MTQDFIQVWNSQDVIGRRIGFVHGPGENPADKIGVVIEKGEDKFYKFLVVSMMTGETKRITHLVEVGIGPYLMELCGDCNRDFPAGKALYDYDTDMGYNWEDIPFCSVKCINGAKSDRFDFTPEERHVNYYA